ncbi:MAG: RidA family protein [Planctomycetia bacterium]|nr:RidA family protein [Planctomycetia bacterium]
MATRYSSFAVLQVILTLFVIGTVPLLAHAAETEIRFVAPNDAEGSSGAVIVPDLPLAHTGQFLPLDAKGNLVGAGDAAVQVDAVLSQVDAALKTVDSGEKPVIVKLHVIAADLAAAGKVREALAKRFAGDQKPAVSCVVGRLRAPGALVALDAVAVLSSKVNARGVPAKSLARAAPVAVLSPGPKVYVSGQAEKGSDVAEMTRNTLNSLEATLKHLGLGLKDIVQVKSFVGPFETVPQAEAEIVKFFAGRSPIPPLVFVEWTTAPSIEIELIASAAGAARDQSDTVEFITPPGMSSSPVFSRVARMSAGPSIYISGLYGKTANNGATEVREIFGELKDVLGKTGSDLRHLVKATYYVSTNEASTKLGEIRPEYYDPKRPPAASKAPVTSTGRDGRTITIDMIAAPLPK